MKLKPRVSLIVDSTGKWAALSAIMMGIAFFFRAIYYLVVHNLTACSGAEITLCFVLPLLVGLVWILLIRILPLKQPVIYGVLAAVILLLLIVQGFFGGSTLQKVVGSVWYLIAAFVVIIVSFGYYPYRTFVFAVCLLPAVLRGLLAFFGYIRPGNYWLGLPEYAGCMTLLALACFAGMLKRE